MNPGKFLQPRAALPDFGSGWFARLTDRLKDDRWCPFEAVSPTFNHTRFPGRVAAGGLARDGLP